MLRVPDAASIAAMQFLRDTTGISAGASTGTNVWGAVHCIAGMKARNERGSVVALACDRGKRYSSTYHGSDWPAKQGMDPASHRARLDRFVREGTL